MSASTHKHRAAFTLSLRTISPSLSALHASRLRLVPTEGRERDLGPDRPQVPPLTTLTCVQCGHASVRVRVARSGTKKGNGNGKQKTRKITDTNRYQDRGKKRENSRKVADEYGTRKQIPPRVLERTCTMCAFIEHTPVPRGAAALFKSSSSVRKARRAARSRSEETETVERISGAEAASGGGGSSLFSSDSHRTTPQPVAALAGARPPAHTPPVQSLPRAPDPAPKNRLKKKPGLRELLERNRQRQDAAAREKAAPGGLSSFLDGL